MNSITLSRKHHFRFMGYVDQKEENECWNWLGSKNTCGYGKFAINKTSYMAHRVSWILKNGDIPEGLFVLHKCDNRPCVNPNHLYVGTQQENSDDKVNRGRSARGTRNHSKLKEAQVLEIRKLLQEGASQAGLSRIYGVSDTTIRQIGLRNKWNWLE